MIKIYSMNTCPDCIYIHEQVKDNDEYQVIDIGEHVMYLKEFLQLRDTSPVFKECKENGSIGIPCFVKEDGTVTLIPEEIGLKSKPKEQVIACSIKGGC